MIKKWSTIERSKAGEFKIFDIYNVRRHNPDLNKEGEFVIVDSLPWVNIIPITMNNNVVLVEQYRQGTDEITLEIPGGLIHQGENPQTAGVRECIEETGYHSIETARLLGINKPNPAFLNNICYSYIWFNCEKKYSQSLDMHEDINVYEVPVSEIKTLIREGRINHSIVLTAFLFYFLRYELK